MRMFLTLLAFLALGLWIFGYIYLTGLACAYGNASTCPLKWPWELGSEDLIYGVLIPGAVVACLFGLSRLAPLRRPRVDDRDQG